LEKIHEIEFSTKNNDLVNEANKSRQEKPQKNEQEKSLNLNPNEVMKRISNIFENSNGYIVDVGQHQMWAAQSIILQNGQRFLTSGGLGAMGFALPASIGASQAKLGKWVVVIGDGCLQLSLQELQTVSQYNLPITIFIINNNQHGMVAQFQEENMNSRFVGTRDGYSNPNFRTIAEAFNISNYLLVDDSESLENLESKLKSFTDGPAIIEILIENSAKALPKMKFERD
jgi:acetolactate synthase-1/2/3 large subunit